MKFNQYCAVTSHLIPKMVKITWCNNYIGSTITRSLVRRYCQDAGIQFAPFVNLCTCWLVIFRIFKTPYTSLLSFDQVIVRPWTEGNTRKYDYYLICITTKFLNAFRLNFELEVEWNAINLRRIRSLYDFLFFIDWPCFFRKTYCVAKNLEIEHSLFLCTTLRLALKTWVICVLCSHLFEKLPEYA